MINRDLIIYAISLIIGGLVTLFLFVLKEKRSKLMDHWLGIVVIFLLSYKLLPLILSPELVLRPFDLLLLNSGPLGVMLGFLAIFIYHIFRFYGKREELHENWRYLILTMVTSYTLYGLVIWGVDMEQTVGLYRGVLGLVFIVILYKRIYLFSFSFYIYAGLLILIEGQTFSRLIYGFSYFQWLIISFVVIDILLQTTIKRGKVQ